MTADRLPAVVRDLLRGAGTADADLLARFVAVRDEAAFAELVRRHGGPVWDVCRSVLRNAADADDAFQATFLTLARRAADLRKPASVGAWLHGVAVRVSRKARAAASRRQAREAEYEPVPAADPGECDVRAVVHEGLAALPARYREPLVACYLRGLTHDDTAAELGLSKAAVKKRLERGRDRLRAVLRSRGLAPAAILAAPGPAPAHLNDAATRLAAGAAPVPPAILQLVEGAVPMTYAKFTAALVLAAGVGLAVAAQERTPRTPNEPPSFPGPAAKKLNSAPKAEAPAAKAELEGTWTVTWIETGGEAVYDAKNHDETLPPPTFVFDREMCRVTGVRVLHLTDFRFKTDLTTTPKEIDATMFAGPKKGETALGIYQIRGDELRVCLRLQRPDLGRPKGYVTNSGTTLYTFVLTRARGTAAPGSKGAPPGGPAPTPPFDTILRSGNRLYFVIDTPKLESLQDELAGFGRRLELATKVADRVKDKDVSVVLFLRHAPKDAGGGSLTGLSRDQLRRYAALPVEKRGDKLLEHAWTLGRLPKDAVPVPEDLLRDDPPRGKTQPPAPPVDPATAADRPLTAAELAALIAAKGANQPRTAGVAVEFAATVSSVGKGIDGGTVPFVKIEGWPHPTGLYGMAFVHNVPPDRAGKAGDRVRVRGLFLEHGYGTVFLWATRWERLEAAPGPKADAPPREVSIYDRSHHKGDLPGPGTEVRSPKDNKQVYYFTNTMRMWAEPKNAGKHPGLYGSRDGGKTWKLVNTSFEFQTLFAHPTTGDLFAVIEHAWNGTDEKTGELTRFHADKALRSTDGGAKWKDITPPPGYIADINSFFADPDHPGRACFVATVVRGVIYRPRDDRYSGYDVIREASPEGQRLLERGSALVNN